MSDVLPMTQAAGWGADVPYGIEWKLNEPRPEENSQYAHIVDLAGLASARPRIG